jgi:hypothetical protein
MKASKRLIFKHGNVPDSNFIKTQLRMGIKTETEHTNSHKIAKQIAKAHLIENPKYYTKLKKAGL